MIISWPNKIPVFEDITRLTARELKYRKVSFKAIVKSIYFYNLMMSLSRLMYKAIFGV